MMISIVEQVVQSVVSANDKRWIPENLEDYTFFAHTDYWEFFSENPDLDTICEYCNRYDTQAFMGAELRSQFPDLQIQDQDFIYPNVHMTLWGKETCKCILRRVNVEKVKPESLVFYLE
jgi:hypothetical protein